MNDIIQDLEERIKRKSSNFKSICAHIDLLGMTDAILDDPEEAQSRIDSLYRGIYDSLEIHPGLNGYKICFYGDSISITKEIIERSSLNQEYKKFCGHVICLVRHIADVEKAMNRPGIRAFTAYGKLIPLTDPKKWEKKHLTSPGNDWFILTGCDEALAKCHKADENGSKKGFEYNHLWCEAIDSPGTFIGIPFNRLPIFPPFSEGVYIEIYKQIVVEQCTKKVKLDYKSWEENDL